MEEQNIENKENKDDKNKPNTENNTQPLQIITKETSLDSNLFFNPQIFDYRCIICENIPSPEIAYEAICCPILFCKNCIMKWINQTPKCPLCKKPLHNDNKYLRNIKVDNTIFYNMFQRFKIRCPYGCQWEGIWMDLENHLFNCEKGVRQCKYKDVGCEYIDSREKIIEHENNNVKVHLDLAMKFIKDNYNME